MTSEEIEKILDEQGVDGAIAAIYPQGDPKRIALLRIHHATENTQSALNWLSDSLSYYLAAPAVYKDHIPEQAEDMASKLEALAAELRKSMPVFARYPHAERTPGGLLGENPPEPAEDGATGGADADWGDVPF